MTDLIKAKTLGDWPKMRKEIASIVTGVLGSLPKERIEPQLKMVDEIQFTGYVRQRVSYFVSDWERIAAWLFIPDGAEELPVIICCHGMVPQGKDETAGLEGDPLLGFARHFAELGHVTIAPDCVATGDRVSRGKEPFNTNSCYKDYPKMSAQLKMISDYMCAVDAISELRCVDPSRIGVIGHGLGARNALLLSAYDERVQACVASCAFTRFEDDKQPERWIREDEYRLLPKLEEHIMKKKFPFDWEHILALVAPSPSLLINASKPRDGFNPKSTEKAVGIAKNIYKLLGAPKALDVFTHESYTSIDLESLDVADDWFARWL